MHECNGERYTVWIGISDAGKIVVTIPIVPENMPLPLPWDKLSHYEEDDGDVRIATANNKIVVCEKLANKDVTKLDVRFADARFHLYRL